MTIREAIARYSDRGSGETKPSAMSWFAWFLFTFAVLWQGALFYMALMGQKGEISQSTTTWLVLTALGLFVSVNGLMYVYICGAKPPSAAGAAARSAEQAGLIQTKPAVPQSESRAQIGRFAFVMAFSTAMYFIELCDIVWIRDAMTQVEVDSYHFDGHTSTLLVNFPAKQIDYFYMMIQLQFVATFAIYMTSLWFVVHRVNKQN